MIAPYPLADERLDNPQAETDMTAVKAAIHAGRSLRSSYSIPPSVRRRYASFCSRRIEYTRRAVSATVESDPRDAAIQSRPSIYPAPQQTGRAESSVSA